MVKALKKIKWDKIASDGLRAAVNYIRQDSIKNSEKVRKDLLAKISSLKDQPEKYPLDKYKKLDDAIYRAFEVHHYRVSYTVTNEEIIITQIRHTSMEPLEH